MIPLTLSISSKLTSVWPRSYISELSNTWLVTPKLLALNITKESKPGLEARDKRYLET